MSNFLWQYALYGLICYLICNFNFAVFISKKVKKTDIRTVGSGNPGTTNMFRVFGFKLGLVTFICDMLKGLVCALAGKLIFGQLAANAGFEQDVIQNASLFGGYYGGLCAGLGHVFPVLFGFKGGKGFATGLGVFLATDPIIALMAVAVGIVVLLITDLMSPFALLFFTAMTLSCALKLLPDCWQHFIVVALYYVMVLFAHRHNIKRLCLQQENKMGISKLFKRDSSDEKVDK